MGNTRSVAKATEMERKLRAALEAGDSEELQRLCGEVGSNIELKVGGFGMQNLFFRKLLKMPLAHHVACKPVSSSCLELLIDRFGPGCLTHINDSDQTPVHLAAQHQDESWMKLVKEKGGRGCLRIVDKWGQTVAHFAAMNRKSSSCLKWLVKELGSDCLTAPDKDGDTAVHLAARHQGIESLEWIKRQIGTDCFRLKTKCDRTAFHFAAQKSDSSNLKWLVKELGSDCLTVPDKEGDTAVHLAALYQGIESLEWIKRQIGTDCFRLKTKCDRTAFHFAAQKSDSSNLKWLVNELGSDCLTVPDRDGDTAVHLAAKHQPVDSLQFIFDQIGAEMFSLKSNRGITPADVVERFWLLNDQSAKQAWISSTQRLLEASQPHAGAKKQLDPSFTDWDFILQDEKKQLIGLGGFGEVFKALTDRNQTVAVKVLPMSQAEQDAEELKIKILMEKRGVEILKRLSHPNIVQFLKCEQKSDGLYIFTELVSGHSLFELMQRQNKPFKESGVRDFSRQICLGLNFLHCQPQGAILHRDIKSSNVMLTNKGVIKLIDFGLAKEIVGTSDLSDGVDPKGTWHFLAPELFMGDGESIPYSAKTDVWAFGCTVYELTAMQPPDANVQQFRIAVLRCEGRAMPQIADGFSAGLKDFYLRCVDYDPRERADTAELLGHSFLRVSS
ncbi:hypothetical protein BOX15_Mlig032061g1 [Macrostomum lignano]|uniref:Protein kinase domain-containing protein n=1 Tax=Macrostomum lignano TaxID=282301 RepID=A0A267GGN5_9PLAT|nr:hypothetical protein BOX15_Mlig032061g1 [Macrostomum lignano]